MQLNIKQLDQTHWVCYEFENHNYYYGEVAYLDEHGNIHPKDSVQMATNQHARLVKHGVGVFIYGINGDHISKYQGNWQKDKKSGFGKLVYSDKSTYKGNWKDDMKHQNGKFTWPNGNIYEGFWKRNRLDGVGVFKHYQGFELKGNFRCNYFIEGQSLRNPFFTLNEYETFKKSRKDILKLKQKISKQKVGFIERISRSNHQELDRLINRSNNHNRIPLIVSSNKCNYQVKDFGHYSTFKNKQFHNFDLRKLYVTPAQDRQTYYDSITKMLQNTLTNGDLFIINLDDSDVHYSQLFYPDIREFYHPNSLPAQIWSKQQLSKIQVFEPLFKSSKIQISKHFNLALWTKFRVDETIDNKKIIEKLEKRFESVIPIIKVDYILLTN